MTGDQNDESQTWRPAEPGPPRDVAAELVACRLESPTAAATVLGAATQLVAAMPAGLTVEPSVYAGLQRLACGVDTAIFAADCIRQQRRDEAMTTTATQPDPQKVGDRADTILEAIHADVDFERLVSSTSLYASCWSTFTGYPIVANFDLDSDTEPLLAEALKVLSLKAAVFELTEGDEATAELLVSAPVDEMVHAVLAQHTLVVQLQHRIGIALVHMTDRERFGWEPGDYTEQCYRAAGWGDPPARYWVPADEAARRLVILDAHYRSIGVTGGGRRVAVDFDIEAAALAG